MIEVTGDSSREGDWAVARLRLDGERIVAADTEGLERPLTGLTLLEAAAVGGETLAVDALANALGPVFRARRDPGRVAVAMSGGVDSAVALLRAGPGAIGVTLRLWLDPQGPSAERACCSPAAVIAARELCHARGVPHVTLDMREAFRGDVVAAFARGYARGETPNPCIRCNGSFRFAALLAFARRAGAVRLATGHYARIVRRGEESFLARALDADKDQSYMLARLAPRRLEQLWFPLGEQSKDATRAEARHAGLGAAGMPESQEACFLAGGDYRSVPRPARAARAGGRDRRPRRARARPPPRLLGPTPGQRRGLGVSAGTEPLYALTPRPATNRVVVGPRSALGRRRVGVDGRLYAPVGRADAKLRYRSPALPARVGATSTWFPGEPGRARLRRGPRPGRCALRR